MGLFVKQPIVVSFYTSNTPYQLEVLNLIQSCQQFEIDHCIEGRDCQGSWERNCALKPFFIREKFLEYQRPLLWVDADAVFLQKPCFKPFLSYDMAIREMKDFVRYGFFKFCAGTLFFNYNAKMVQFMQQWCDLCAEKIAESDSHLLFLDQRSLADMMQRESDLKVWDLPIPYCRVFDFETDQMDRSAVIIEHYQASRRFRKL